MVNGDGQIGRFVHLLGAIRGMSAKDRVLSALNFLTGEGISYVPTGVDEGAIQALIDDYFNTH